MMTFERGSDHHFRSGGGLLRPSSDAMHTPCRGREMPAHEYCEGFAKSGSRSNCSTGKPASTNERRDERASPDSVLPDSNLVIQADKSRRESGPVSDEASTSLLYCTDAEHESSMYADDYDDEDEEWDDDLPLEDPEPLASSANAASYIEALLQDSMRSFHVTGPLVHPINGACSTGSMPSVSQCLGTVLDVKDFAYGIFWKLNTSRGSFEFSDGQCLQSSNSSRFINGCTGRSNAERAQLERLSQFYARSVAFESFFVGSDLPGRVAVAGSHEWIPDISRVPEIVYRRAEQASQAGICSVVCVCLQGGVVEFGSTTPQPENLSTVQFIRTVCGQMGVEPKILKRAASI